MECKSFGRASVTAPYSTVTDLIPLIQVVAKLGTPFPFPSQTPSEPHRSSQPLLPSPPLNPSLPRSSTAMWSINQHPGQYYDPVRDSMRNVQYRMYPNEHMGHFNSPHGYALWGNYNDMYSRNAGILNTGFAGGRMPQAHDARQARRDYIAWVRDMQSFM
nr:hypothetical protein B0A51_16312 [Rachicladosporium sp. CCFEE 5018]